MGRRRETKSLGTVQSQVAVRDSRVVYAHIGAGVVHLQTLTSVLFSNKRRKSVGHEGKIGSDITTDNNATLQRWTLDTVPPHEQYDCHPSLSSY